MTGLKEWGTKGAIRMKIQQTSIDYDYKPTLPADRTLGIGIVGCGVVVKTAHLKAYAKYGLNVVGVYDISPEATRGIQE